MNLKCKLQAGSNNNCVNAVRVFGELIQGGERECSSFSRSCLGVYYDTFSTHDGGNGQCLYFGGFVVLDFLTEIYHPRGKIQVVE